MSGAQAWGNGYSCQLCSVWVPAGTYHQCLQNVGGLQIANQFPTITTSGTTNVYVQGQAQPYVPNIVPPKDDSPMAWLRDQVEEVCELGRAA